MNLKKETRKVLIENVFIPFITAICFVGLFFITIFLLNRSSKSILQSDQVLFQIEVLEKEILHAQSTRREYLLGSKDAKQSYFLSVSEIKKEINALKTLIQGDEIQLERLDLIKSRFEKWQKDILPIFKVYENDPSKLVSKYINSTIKADYEDLVDTLAQFRDHEKAVKHSRKSSSHLILIYITFTFIPLLVLITGITVFRGRKSILNIFEMYADQSSKYIEQMKELENENWIQNKESELNKYIANCTNIEDLGQILLNYCVDQFSALAGVFYIHELHEIDKTKFRLISTIGLTTNLNAEQSSVALSELHFKSTITNSVTLIDLEDIGRNWEIKTGLIELRPSKILSVPLIFSGQLVGLLEIAFQHEVDKNILNFFNLNLGNLSGYLRNILLMQQAEALLIELKNKTDELKNSNDELKERALLLKDTQDEIEIRNTELEQINIVLKDQKNLLKQKNLELESSQKVLDTSTEDLKKANRHKSEFLANMSHELRTPLSSIIGFAELIKLNKNHKAQYLNYVDIILRNSKHLLDLVNDVLDLSKVEAGQLSIDLTEVDIRQAIKESIEITSDSAKKKNVTIKVEIPDNIPKAITADKTRFKQVLVNLINNGIKFSPAGLVKIHAQDMGEKVFLFIEDTGIGIEDAKRHLLFLPFSQLTDDDSIYARQGSGLGLCLSKKLMQQMGGTIELESSALNVGSIFKVEIFKSTYGGQTLANNDLDTFIPNEDSLKGLRILAADDSEDNQILLDEVLSQYGARLTTVGNGVHALNTLAESEYDIVLMDFKMPIMDGFEATQKIRESGCKIPIILLTANAMDGERFRSLKIGADAYSSKPIDWTELIKCILHLTK